MLLRRRGGRGRDASDASDASSPRGRDIIYIYITPLTQPLFPKWSGATPKYYDIPKFCIGFAWILHYKPGIGVPPFMGNGDPQILGTVARLPDSGENMDETQHFQAR